MDIECPQCKRSTLNFVSYIHGIWTYACKVCGHTVKTGATGTATGGV